jgi:hypothetical protein
MGGLRDSSRDYRTLFPANMRPHSSTFGAGEAFLRRDCIVSVLTFI